MALDVKKLIQIRLTDDQYINEVSDKKQIVIHHTASSASAINNAKYWQGTKDRIATSFIIAGNVKNSSAEKDGDIVQCFGSSKWAYHLGIKQDVFKAMDVPYQSLDKISIGIEICAWGQLTKGGDGIFKNYVGGIVPVSEVTTLDEPYRGFLYYHSYTEKQIAALRDLLIYLCDKFNISKKYNADIFEVNKKALSGENGIWNHTSFRFDKNDTFPQPSLIKMLQDLEKGI